MAREGWKVLRLGDVCTKIGSGATPRGGKEAYLEDGPYRLIRSQNVHNDRFRPDGLACIDEQQASELSNVEVFDEDVLLNITGDSVARSCQVAPDVLPARVNQHVAIIRPNPSVLSPSFLRYFLVRPDIQTELLSWAGSGGTRNALTKRMIESFEICVPPSVDEQYAIGHILSTLDERIELNRRMCETLESMAQTLFKSWFVDFDPVRTKIDGRLPDFGIYLADLFADRLVESQRGTIPEGWTYKSLDEIATFINGLALQKYPPKDDFSLPVIKIAQLRTGNTPGSDLASSALNPKFVVQDGDILFSWSGSLECRLWTGGEGALNQHLFKVVPIDAPKWLCYLMVHRHLEDFRAIAAGKATTMGHIQRHHLSDAMQAIPPLDILHQLDPMLRPIVDNMVGLGIEVARLTELKEALLPNLVSGKVELRDVLP